MKKRTGIAFLVIGILSITTLVVMYDLREYDEYNPEQQDKSMTINHSMYNTSLVSLNLTESITFPPYYFENLEINEVFIRQIVFSSDSELVYVYIFPRLGSTFFEGNVTPDEDFVTLNITFLYPIDYERFRIFLRDLSSILTTTNVTIEIDYVIDCAFVRPPKHTISEMIFSIDILTWTSLGVFVIASSLILISLKLTRK